eukprot:3190269-Prorocentrum_lima.AAC.1
MGELKRMRVDRINQRIDDVQGLLVAPRLMNERVDDTAVSETLILEPCGVVFDPRQDCAFPLQAML